VDVDGRACLDEVLVRATLWWRGVTCVDGLWSVMKSLVRQSDSSWTGRTSWCPMDREVHARLDFKRL
jgi:hypothetical protein